MTVAWVPVVDISRHQGAVDFRKMRNMGVTGLILRIAHGLTLDDRAEVYYPDAINAGFEPDEIGFYSFLNPKRGSGAQTAAFAVAAISNITGRDDFLYMLDIENYQSESPNVGQAPVFGAAYAAYIREHIATVNLMAPKVRVIGYTNRAYWNGKVNGTEWVGDDQLAADLDWIVARYPAYSLAAYQRRPLPATPDGWDEWAFNAAPDGPFPPRGGKWAAWQFSAGYNRQGAAYGVSSADLDLNFVHPEAWARWTGKTEPVPVPEPQPPQEIDMPAFISNKTAGKYGAAPSPQGGCTIWEMEHRTKVALSFEAWVAYGMPFGIALDDQILDGIPDYIDTSDPAINDRLAKLESVNILLNDAVGRTGQVIGDMQKGLDIAANARV